MNAIEISFILTFVKYWYLIKTKPRQEKIAKQNLENQGYGVFCPIANINNQHIVLFPGYLFVQLNEKTQNWSPINSMYVRCLPGLLTYICGTEREREREREREK